MIVASSSSSSSIPVGSVECNPSNRSNPSEQKDDDYTFTETQKSTQTQTLSDRFAIYGTALQTFKDIPKTECLCNVKQYFQEFIPIGKGSHGSVYRAELETGPGSPVSPVSPISPETPGIHESTVSFEVAETAVRRRNPESSESPRTTETRMKVAVKHQIYIIKELPKTKSFYEWADSTSSENIAALYGSSFVLYSICPNFSMIYRAFGCIKDNIAESNLLMEYSDTNLCTYLQKHKHLKAKHIVSMVFQIFTAILGLHVFADYVHNDLKRSNVLVDTVEDNTVYEYRIFGKTYYVPLYNTLLKLTDFGLATGPLAAIPHESAPQWYFPKPKQRFTLTSYLDPRPETVHVLQVDMINLDNPTKKSPLPAYARDFWLITSQLSGMSHMIQKNMPIGWLSFIMTQLQVFGMQNPKDAIDFFHNVFKPQIMEEFFGPPGLFTGKPSIKPNEVFDMNYNHTVNTSSLMQLYVLALSK